MLVDCNSILTLPFLCRNRMIRILFSVLAVVAAVLALVLDRPILYAAAAALLLVVVIVWITVAWRRHRAAAKSFKPVTTAPPAPEENLQSLGILEIRPKEPSSKSQQDTDSLAAPTVVPAAEETPDVPEDEETRAEGVPDPTEAAPAEKVLAEETHAEEAFTEKTQEQVEDRPEPAPTIPEPAEATPTPAVETPSQIKEFVSQPAEPAPHTDVQTNGHKPALPDPHDEAVLGPYLQALRAALKAHTVCVLKQEDLVLDYHVVALVGEEGPASPGGDTFSAVTPLLTARMAEHAVTVRPVNTDDLLQSSLGYSDAPERIRQVALAPVPLPTNPDTYFILADTPQTDLLNRPRARVLLTQFARLLGTLLDSATPEPASTESSLRPRREIIAEEMEQARARDQVLALALVYLNQAEDIAATSEAAVAEAEGLLRLRLGQAAYNGRVVRFGELTYGVFYDGNLLEVEAWGTQIQEALSAETGLLEGGVSIGIALLQDRHQTPDAFRADATEALREAYETGTCTILE